MGYSRHVLGRFYVIGDTAGLTALRRDIQHRAHHP